MLKYLFLLLALLVAGTPAGAQVLRPSGQLDSLGLVLPTPLAAPDTAAALHRLFAAKRRSMRVAMPFLITVGAGLLAAGYQPQNPVAALNGISGVVVGFVAIASIAVSFTDGMRYSKKHEAEATQAFEEHRLPTTWRHELKPSYFRPTKAIP